MSTSAETARDWLKQEQPGTERVQEMIQKLQDRIEKAPADDPRVQGSIEALDVLEAALDQSESGQPTSSQTQGMESAELDLSPLVDHAHVAEERPADEKRAAFEALKKQLDRK